MTRKNAMKYLGLLSAILCMAAITHAAEQPLTLVKDGQPTSVIVIPATTNETAAFGARELQSHLKKITGAEVPIVKDRAKVDADKVRIIVGDSHAARELGVTSQGFQRQEYTLRAFDNAIVLLGPDHTQYPGVTGGTPKFCPKGKFGGAIQDWCSIGIKDHAFNDEQGTMECFICAAGKEEGPPTGGILFRIGDDKNGHYIYNVGDPAALSYETYVNGQASKIRVPEVWKKLGPGWHHLMATWDAAAGKAELFLDGKSMGTAPYTKASCAGSPYFGIRGDTNNIPNAWGPLDEVRLSKVVRKPVVPTEPYQTDDDTLALLHFDEPSYLWRDDSEYPRPGLPPSPEPLDPFGYVGTVYAVYDFLEKCCGVRWYAPTDEGMVCPQTKTLTVTVKDMRRRPAMDFRSGTGPSGEWGLVSSRVPASSPDHHVFCLRLKMGGRRMLVTHSFEGWPERFWEKNPQLPNVFEKKRPEFFAMNRDGSRNPNQMCFSSPELLEQVIKDARAFFDKGQTTHRAVSWSDEQEQPEAYVIAPRDTPVADCQCPKCAARIDKGKWGPFTSGRSSETWWDFANKVQKAINKSHPGRHIVAYAYFDYAYYPKTLEVDRNILVTPCLHTPYWFASWDRRIDLGCYKPWASKMPRGNIISMWLYQCFPWETGDQYHQNFKVFPSWHAHLLDKEMKMFARDGVRGIFLCGVTPYIDGYLTYKLMDDPTLDVDKTLDEFFTGYYGAAAEPMKKLYLSIEKTYCNTSNYSEGVRSGTGSGGQSAEIWFWLGRPERMESWGKLLEEAKAKADTDAAKKHVAVYEKDIWRDHMQQGYNTWLSKQPGGKHPWPLYLGAAKTMKWHAVKAAPFIKNVFFRDTANGFSVYETGFDDQKGTMEAWVSCGEPADNHWHGTGPLFDVVNLKPESSHRVWVDGDVKRGVLIPKYETKVDGKTSLIVGKPMTANQWHHIAACWHAEKGAMALYVDGKLSGKAKYTATECAGEAFTIGRPGFGPIAEVRLSNVVRRPDVQKNPYKTDENTLSLLHFDEEPGERIKDSSKIAK